MHEMHFKAILAENSYIAAGWEVFLVNKSIGKSGLRPDWVIINRNTRQGFIIDITSKFNPRHYKKGLTYVDELNKLFNDPQWRFTYLEDYWVNAVIH